MEGGSSFLPPTEGFEGSLAIWPLEIVAGSFLLSWAMTLPSSDHTLHRLCPGYYFKYFFVCFCLGATSSDFRGYYWLCSEVAPGLGTIWDAGDQTQLVPGQPSARQTPYLCYRSGPPGCYLVSCFCYISFGKLLEP